MSGSLEMQLGSWKTNMSHHFWKGARVSMRYWSCYTGNLERDEAFSKTHCVCPFPLGKRRSGLIRAWPEPLHSHWMHLFRPATPDVSRTVIFFGGTVDKLPSRRLPFHIVHSSQPETIESSSHLKHLPSRVSLPASIESNWLPHTHIHTSPSVAHKIM
jgi:hypothetical protein